MSTSNQHEPCYRIYLGKSNWVNLSPQVTADLKAIYEEGKHTRYKLAPGLLIDILPRDVDCNSKTTELPKLMRADLCYDDDEGNISAQIKTSNDTTTTSSSTTLTERQQVVQQNLSRFIKAELEKQGIVDAFPPNETGQELLPPVSTLAPHRHLGLVPAPYKNTKRTLQRQKQPLDTEKQPSSSSSLSPSLASSSSPLLDPSYAPSSSRPPTKRKQTSKKTHKDDKAFTSSSTSSSSGDSAASNNTPTKLAGKKIQPPPPYQLRSSTSTLSAEKKTKIGTASTPPLTKAVSSPLAVDTSLSRAPLLPYQPKQMFNYDDKDDDDATTGDNNGSGRGDFFPGIDFVTPTNTMPSFWYNSHFPQQPQQPQRMHPATLTSPSLPILHHHHHHHHQFQLQPRDHPYQHARIQHFPDDGEDDDNPPAAWNLHEWPNRHHYHHSQQQQQQQQHHQDFDIYSTSMYSVSSPPPPPFHRYDVDPASKIGIDPTDLQQPPNYTHDTSDRGGSSSTLSAPSPSGMHDQMQHSPYPHQHHRHHHHPFTGRYYPENQYANTPHLTSFFMPPVADAAATMPSVTHVEDASTDTTALLSTSSPSPPCSSSHFPVQDTDTPL